MRRYRQAGAALKRTQGNIAISYGTLRYPLPPPTRFEAVSGGASKLTYLAEEFPHSYPSCSILYLVNSVFSRPLLEVVRAARKKSIPMVLNQNGVYHPALYEFDWKRANKILAELYATAQYVIYQSQFSRICAERYLGSIDVPWIILHNPVDTNHFTPMRKPQIASGPVLLSIASRINSFYRIEISLAALANLRKTMPGARLIIPGYDSGHFGDRQAVQLIYAYAHAKQIPPDAIEILPPFSKQEAPAVLNRAHILLHISHHDSAPSFVLEAMACGLPAVFLANGGTPELVSDAAGIGIPSETNWEKAVLPDPVRITEAVTQIVERWEDYSAAARQHTCDRFNLADFRTRHRAIFSELTK
jgi:glycosyltransferase involved in cell wall biosynthesis